MDYLIKGETLTDIADAIRGKTGESGEIQVSQMASQIESIPSGGGGSVDYSTTEHEVGTWIDGSTLYEKTISMSNVSVSQKNSTSGLVHGVSGLNFGWVEQALVDMGNGFFNGIGNIVKTGSNSFVYTSSWCVGDTSVYVIFNRSDMEDHFSASVDRKYIVTIRYTKTLA